MQHSNIIFISVFILALCKYAVSTASVSGNLPADTQKLTELPASQNSTVESQVTTKNAENKPTKQDGTNTNMNELQQTTTKTTKDVNPIDSQDKSTSPFPKRRMSDVSKQNVVDAISKIKLKYKMTKTKTELKENAEPSKKVTFAKYSDKIDALFGRSPDKTKKYVLLARNSKELKDNMKREQLLEWLYNARPLFENETRLWANENTEKKNKPTEDSKEKAETHTEKEHKKDKDQKIEAEFQTVEASKEKQSSATKRREDNKKSGDAALPKESTTKQAVTAANDPEDSDSSGNGLRLESAKSKEAVKKVKITANKEHETETTSEETVENVTEKNKRDKPKEKIRTVQRFAPTNDGPSSSESTSVS